MHSCKTQKYQLLTRLERYTAYIFKTFVELKVECVENEICELRVSITKDKLLLVNVLESGVPKRKGHLGHEYRVV